MELKEAFDITYQLARAAPVNGEIGDKRDQALAMLKKLVDDALEKKTDKVNGG